MIEERWESVLPLPVRSKRGARPRISFWSTPKWINLFYSGLFPLSHVSDEEKFEVELKYVETPKGRVTTHETTKEIARAIEIISEEESKLEEKLREIESRNVGSEALTSIRDTLENIEKMEVEILSRLDALVDAFQELLESPGSRATSTEKKQVEKKS